MSNPNPNRVLRFLDSLRDAVTVAGLAYEIPHCVNTTHDDELVFEWWKSDRKLTVYVDPDGHAEYVISWGESIASDMGDGAVFCRAVLPVLWRWLAGTSDELPEFDVLTSRQLNMSNPNPDRVKIIPSLWRQYKDRTEADKPASTDTRGTCLYCGHLSPVSPCWRCAAEQRKREWERAEAERKKQA